MKNAHGAPEQDKRLSAAQRISVERKRTNSPAKVPLIPAGAENYAGTFRTEVVWSLFIKFAAARAVAHRGWWIRWLFGNRWRIYVWLWYVVNILHSKESNVRGQNWQTNVRDKEWSWGKVRNKDDFGKDIEIEVCIYI